MSRLKPPNIFQLEIQLRGATIPVWRILEVPLNTTLHDLHLYIQAAMGWECSHLYEFNIGKVFYQFVFPEEFVEHPSNKNVKDSTKFKLKDFNLEIGNQFSYEYDFGDGWAHDITVKAITVDQYSVIKLPNCTAGAMACPPEDLGGIYVYNQLVQFRLHKTPIKVNPDLEEYYRDFDIYKLDSIRSFSFELIVKAMRRAYK
jgi:Plasmid pRiA4b ORF-3-like protein